MLSGKEQKEEEAKTSIADMPVESLVHLFSFLGKRDLGKLARVSKSIKAIAEDDHLWLHPDADLMPGTQMPRKEIYRLFESGGNHKQRLMQGEITPDDLQKQLACRFPEGKAKRAKVGLILTRLDNKLKMKVKESFASYCENHAKHMSYYDNKNFEQFFTYINIGIVSQGLRQVNPFLMAASIQGEEGGWRSYFNAIDHSQVVKAWNELTAIIIVSPFLEYELSKEIKRMCAETNKPSPIIFLAGSYSEFGQDIDIENLYAYPRDQNEWVNLGDMAEFVCALWPSIEEKLSQLSQIAKRFAPSTVNEQPHKHIKCSVM